MWIDADSLAGEEWRPRSDYLLGSIEPVEESSYGSSNGYLPVPYHYTSQVSLKLNTNINSPHLSDDGSSAGAVNSSTSYFDNDSYMNGYRTLSPSVRHMGRSSGRDPVSPKQYRTKPYSSRTDKKRWSGNNASSYYSLNVDPQLQPQYESHYSTHHSSPENAHTHLQQNQHSYLPAHQHELPRGHYLSEQYGERDDISQLISSSMYIPSQCHPGDRHHHGSSYGEYSERPDLFACLTEEQIPPPPEDMNPEDPDMIPHEQALRFEGDLYTPRWVRGQGANREGWCGICKPGRWLVLKNSAFWYDKSFSHGVSAVTCLPFSGPREMRRMDGNPDVWEGLCHQCNEWMQLVSNKKKGTTWYRHAYKCHTHNKVKDAPKRRREGGHSKARAKEGR